MRQRTRLVRAAWWRRRRRLGTSFIRFRRRPTVARCHCSISSTRFFAKFVATRKPAILDGHLPEMAALPARWWAAERTHSHKVQVEVRDGARDVFGKGRRTTMRYGDLLHRLEDGDTSHYLTTQETSGDRLLSPPLTALGAELPGA